MNEHLGSYPGSEPDDGSEFGSKPEPEGHGLEREIEPTQPTGGVLDVAPDTDALNDVARKLARVGKLDAANDEITRAHTSPSSGMPPEVQKAYMLNNDEKAITTSLSDEEMDRDAKLREAAKKSPIHLAVARLKARVRKFFFG